VDLALITLLPEIHIDLTRAVCLAVFILLFGCQIEDIAIDVLEADNSVELVIYKENSSDPVELMWVRVTEDYSGIVWEIGTFDRSDLYEMREGKQVPKFLPTFLQLSLCPFLV
jgi:hypothetical protein